MELARRLDMEVQHLYWDGDKGLSIPDYWPYAGTTGVGMIPSGVASMRAAELAGLPDTEVYLCAGLEGAAIPGVARNALLAAVKGGKGLLIANPPGRMTGWPEELFEEKDESAAAAAILAGLAWDQVPGWRTGDRGRVGEGPVVEAVPVWAGAGGGAEDQYGDIQRARAGAQRERGAGGGAGPRAGGVRAGAAGGSGAQAGGDGAADSGAGEPSAGGTGRRAGGAGGERGSGAGGG